MEDIIHIAKLLSSFSHAPRDVSFPARARFHRAPVFGRRVPLKAGHSHTLLEFTPLSIFHRPFSLTETSETMAIRGTVFPMLARSPVAWFLFLGHFMGDQSTLSFAA